MPGSNKTCYTESLRVEGMARGNFGERLKRERELREVTLREITSATRIGTRFLEALENEDWEKLPGGVFNRGFVRSVARYRVLDEEALLAEYDLAHGAQVPSADDRLKEEIRATPRWVPAAVVLGILILLAGLIAGGMYAWKYFTARRSQKQSMTSSAPAPPQPALQISPTAPANLASQANFPSAPPPATLDLLVSAAAATHLVIQSDGNVVFDNDLRAGENRHFTASGEFKVTAADSGAVLLELNGQAMPPLGVPGASGTMKLGRKDLR
jgi:cytoskeleton protein RodZ